MIKHKQLFRHRPQEGHIGDCWRTVFACLLDKLPGEVPHFVESCWNDNKAANAAARSWLATQGLSYIELAYSPGDLQSLLDSVGAINPGTFYILGGNSRTGVGHSVICLDNAIFWDPSLDDVGIVGPMDDGFYWVSYLVPLLHLVKSADWCGHHERH